MASKKISRRLFVAGGLAATAAGIIIGKKPFSALLENSHNIHGRIAGNSAARGHLLRNFQFPLPSSTEYEKVVIIGGGVSGLSAARWLSKNKFNDFTLLELNEMTGGNSIYGTTAVSEHPWGAHYLPVPEASMTALIDFLRECGTVTGFDTDGLPIYNEFHLCAAPEDRLFIHGTWQKGIIPSVGISDDDSEQIRKFLSLMESYKELTGKDGKPAFAIPVSRSSEDAELLNLDNMLMRDWLQEQGFTSPYLKWYLNYCCRDDYGSTIETTSAWAGIHYFAARKGQGANAEHAAMLTWPEGNGLLVKKLNEYGKDKRLNAMAYSVELTEEGVKVLYYDFATETSKCMIAEKVIVATPEFVNSKIIKIPERRIDASVFTYTPWIAATLTLSEMPAGNGFPLSWDNVIYDSPSLGYINATHQHLSAFEKKKVITYYLPLTEPEPKEARQRAYEKKYDDWKALVLTDLKKAHGNIEKYIERLDVFLWGHGMIRPMPGLISGTERKKAMRSVQDQVFFAHSDHSGISIFEEAFYHGIRAANEALRTL